MLRVGQPTFVQHCKARQSRTMQGADYERFLDLPPLLLPPAGLALRIALSNLPFFAFPPFPLPSEVTPLTLMSSESAPAAGRRSLRMARRAS